ncbi:NAD(P)/FAD-dependent oxidoreductase [Candidatus Kapabacteria bacterium]|nr:NAD(P)/FAD-dependent oxidoreductase [Candidatus Kapabacteria bacterium]
MKNKKYIIAGAGLGGSLLGVLLAKKGFDVEIFESRPDMRRHDIAAGRSINLALSDRGIQALKKAGLSEAINKIMMPMAGRLIHSVDGQKQNQPYSGKKGRVINSISRGGLNSILMTEAEKYDNLEIHFESKIIDIDWDKKEFTYWSDDADSAKKEDFDIIFGADGAGSEIRTNYQRGGLRMFNYSQEFLEHGYKELEIPSNMDGSYKIETDVLHIWPRGQYMMIALPNKDGSFTCTLFMPYHGEQGFDNLKTKDQVSNFFNEKFPDAVPFMPTLLDDFFENPTAPLATVKCYPWVKGGDSALLGDAAHAVVPFYGQGMNASFEDVGVLDDLINQDPSLNWEEIFDKYQKLRKVNADAIAELAIDNYKEMRSHVADPTFQIKRHIEMALESRYSDFNSKYSLVTFEHEVPYSVAKSLGERQDEYLMKICKDVKDWTSLDLDDIYNDLIKLRK